MNDHVQAAAIDGVLLGDAMLVDGIACMVARWSMAMTTTWPFRRIGGEDLAVYSQISYVHVDLSESPI